MNKDEAKKQLAANLLWLDRKTVVSGTFTPRTNAKLQSLGYKVHSVEFTNVKQIWGSFRCAVCPLVRES